MQISAPDLRLAAVSITPSWFERVVLRREARDFNAFAEVGLHGGLEWYVDGAGRCPRITDRTLVAELHYAWWRADRDERERVLARRR